MLLRACKAHLQIDDVENAGTGKPFVVTSASSVIGDTGDALAPETAPDAGRNPRQSEAGVIKVRQIKINRGREIS